MADGRRDPPDDGHRRPEGTDDGTVEGVGKLSEAVEWIERARGRLFDFHQLIGRADLLLEEAADRLDDAGHDEAAGRLRTEIIGRNVLVDHLDVPGGRGVRRGVLPPGAPDRGRDLP